MYYKIKHGILQKNSIGIIDFSSLDVLCEQFNDFANKLKSQIKEWDDKYLWLDRDEEKRNLTDK